MFTALLKVPIDSKKDSFFHVRKNGNLVQTLSAKRAILTHEEKPKGASYRGQTYAFFLIEKAEIGDSLRSTNATFASGMIKTPYTQLSVYLSSHYIAIEPPTSADNYCLYRQSAILEEVCNLLIEQGKPIPKSIDSFLKLSVPALFSKVIKADINQYDEGWLHRRMFSSLFDENAPYPWRIHFFDSTAILQSHANALDNLGKTALDYVSQKTIDDFLLELIREYQFEQYICFAQCPYIKVSEKVTQAYVEAYNRYTATLVLAIGSLRKYYVSDEVPSIVRPFVRAIRGYSDNIPTMLLYLKDTPCGSVQIDTSNFKVTLSVYNGTGSYPTARFDMTDSCVDFSSEISYKIRRGIEMSE